MTIHTSNMKFLCMSHRDFSSNANTIHKQVSQLVCNDKIIDQEEYSQIRTAWRIVTPNMIVIETNVDLNSCSSHNFLAVTPIEYPTEGCFNVNFDPLKNIPQIGTRGKKATIKSPQEARSWLEKRIPQEAEILQLQYVGPERNEKFFSYIWSATITLKTQLDTYFIQGSSRAFGLGLLTPDLSAISF